MMSQKPVSGHCPCCRQTGISQPLRISQVPIGPGGPLASSCPEVFIGLAARYNPGFSLSPDKGYDQREFVEELRCMGVTPHVAQNQGRRRSRLDQRTTRHPGYEISQRKRKRIEEVFGWMKTVGMLRQLRHRGLERVGWVFTLAAATYNLVRMRTLMPKCV